MGGSQRRAQQQTQQLIRQQQAAAAKQQKQAAKDRKKASREAAKVQRQAQRQANALLAQARQSASQLAQAQQTATDNANMRTEFINEAQPLNARLAAGGASAYGFRFPKISNPLPETDLRYKKTEDAQNRIQMLIDRGVDPEKARRTIAEHPRYGQYL